jgi:RNA polymerase sigma-70 factor (ECF subfamily)
VSQPTTHLNDVSDDISDEALVKFAKSGHSGAFEKLMRRSWDKALHRAIYFLRDRENAIEEVQWAYVNAYMRLDTLAEDSKFSAWLGRIVTNRCMQRLRTRGRLKVLLFDQIPGALEGSHMSDKHHWCDPEERLGRRQVSDVIQRELQRIPKLLRTPLELYAQGLSAEDIGNRLNITTSAAKTRIGRGKEYLRDRMTRHLGRRGVASLTCK